MEITSLKIAQHILKISPNFRRSHILATGCLFAGDLMDEENVLDFLTSLEAMDLPDRIEEVNPRILDKIVQETDFVAVLFCKLPPNLPILYDQTLDRCFLVLITLSVELYSI
jgi:hypothetical protein